MKFLYFRFSFINFIKPFPFYSKNKYTVFFGANPAPNVQKL